MIAGAMIVGVGGAILSAGVALAARASLGVAVLCYMAGGSVAMLAALALGARRRKAKAKAPEGRAPIRDGPPLN